MADTLPFFDFYYLSVPFISARLRAFLLPLLRLLDSDVSETDGQALQFIRENFPGKSKRTRNVNHAISTPDYCGLPVKRSHAPKIPNVGKRISKLPAAANPEWFAEYNARFGDGFKDPDKLAEKGKMLLKFCLAARKAYGYAKSHRH